MITGGRSHLLELRRTREAAARTVELLEDKYEALMREIATRKREREAHRRKVARQWKIAWTAVRSAQLRTGSSGLAAAALGQPRLEEIPLKRFNLLGAQLIREPESNVSFRPRYELLVGSMALDQAGIAFTALIPDLLRLGQMEANLAALRRSLRKTLRLLNGLEKVLIPKMNRDIGALSISLEEEERDEYSRLRPLVHLRSRNDHGSG